MAPKVNYFENEHDVTQPQLQRFEKLPSHLSSKKLKLNNMRLRMHILKPGFHASVLYLSKIILSCSLCTLYCYTINLSIQSGKESSIFTTNKDWIVTLYNARKLIMKLRKSFKCLMDKVIKILVLINLTGNSKRSRNIIWWSEMKIVMIIGHLNHGSWGIPSIKLVWTIFGCCKWFRKRQKS